jgi:hypothetical protein
MAGERGEFDVVKTLELALSKAASLPEAAQEALGRELLERIDELTQLRAEVEIGLKELDAGLGKELDVEELLRELHAEHARHGNLRAGADRGMAATFSIARPTFKAFKELLLADTPRATLVLPSRGKYRRRQPKPLA